MTDHHLLALKKCIEEVRGNDAFTGTVAGPMALCAKASEGMDDHLKAFVATIDGSIRNAIVCSTSEDIRKVEEILSSFFLENPNLDRCQIHVKKNPACSETYDVEGAADPLVYEFVGMADADVTKPEDVLVYNEFIESLERWADQKKREEEWGV